MPTSRGRALAANRVGGRGVIPATNHPPQKGDIMFRPAPDTRDEATTKPNGGGAFATRPTANKPRGAVALVGYLGAAGLDGYRRLYRDPAVELYIGIRVDDIVDHSSAAGDGAPLAGQSVVWVRRDAGLVWHESMQASNFDSAPTTTPARYKWPRP